MITIIVKQQIQNMKAKHLKSYKSYDLAIDGYQVTSSSIATSAVFVYHTELEIYHYYYYSVSFCHSAFNLRKFHNYRVKY